MYRKLGLWAVMVMLACALTGCKCDHVWQDASCEEPQICLLCDEAQGAALGHSWGNATCDDPRTCSTCGKTRGDANGHQWTEAACTAPKTCSACGETEGEAAGHQWSGASCEVAGHCTVCGENQGQPMGHSWVEATCDAPRTCSACGRTEGSSLGHAWVDASCEFPPSCLRCNATSGHALGHSYGDWMGNDGDDRYRICAACGDTQQGRVDRESMGAKLIAGDWSLAFKYVGDSLLGSSDSYQLSLYAGGSAKWTTPSGTQDAAWSYASYDDGVYRFDLIVGSQRYQLAIETKSGTLLYGYLTMTQGDQLWVFKKA